LVLVSVAGPTPNKDQQSKLLSLLELRNDQLDPKEHQQPSNPEQQKAHRKGRGIGGHVD
jgi:hypothetical protein